MQKILTYPEMNEQIVEILRLRGDCDPVMLYAAQRIEELEQELEDAALAVGCALTEIEMLSQAQAVQRIKELEQEIEEFEQETDSWRAATMTHLVRIEGLERQLQEAEATLGIAVDALAHCETAAPDLTGDVLNVIEGRLTPRALSRICECRREVQAR